MAAENTTTTAASASASTPISAAVESFAASAYEKAAPYFSPLVEGAKARLPTDVVDRLDKAAATATTAAHTLLEQADGAALSVSGKLEDLRKTPDFVKGKVVEGTEFVKAKVADGEGFVKSKVASYGLPTSFAELKEASATQLTNLKAALGKLIDSLPGAQPGHKFEVIPEAQVEKIRASVGKVLESLPKLPAFELPKIDLAAYTPQELVKVGQEHRSFAAEIGSLHLY